MTSREDVVVEVQDEAQVVVVPSPVLLVGHGYLLRVVVRRRLVRLCHVPCVAARGRQSALHRSMLVLALVAVEDQAVPQAVAGELFVVVLVVVEMVFQIGSAQI